MTEIVVKQHILEEHSQKLRAIADRLREATHQNIIISEYNHSDYVTQLKSCYDEVYQLVEKMAVLSDHTANYMMLVMAEFHQVDSELSKS